jgi:thiamine biosynthesis lipoprotein
MSYKCALHNLLNPAVVVLAGGMLTADPLPSRAAFSHAAIVPLDLPSLQCSLAEHEGLQKSNADRLRTFHYENVLGTSLELKIAASPADARAVRAAVLAEISRLAGILSAYESESEFRRWQRTLGRPVCVSTDLFDVLDLFDTWRGHTGGALDASAEVVTRLWKATSDEQRLPSQAELDGAVQSARNIHWRLDKSGRTATHLSDTPLVLNSVAKPYIVDRAAAAALSSPGVSGVVVNIGGDLVVRGALRELVHIADPLSDAENSPPLATLMVHDRAVATSGSYRRGLEIGGRHYSHIIDPRNGQSTDHILSASVVAPNPSNAGALATAFSVLTVEESRQLALTMPEVEFLLVGRDGRRVTSGGWSALEAPHVRLASMTAPAGAAPAGALFAAAAQAPSSIWNPSFELVINLEFTRFDEIPYYRPYVAVWVEDKNKTLVRTIAVWYDQAFWLRELRAWYHAYQMRPAPESGNLASISSATRPAGKYSLKWDGKDDNGKPVKSGGYTVCVEVVRQSAGYEIFRQEMDFTDTPKEIQLAGKVEVSSLSFQYRKASGR